MPLGASLIVDFIHVSVQFHLRRRLRLRLGSGLGLELLEKIFSAPIYRAHCAVIFALVQLSVGSSTRLQATAETPAWILTRNTPNDAFLRKNDPFDGYKSGISYLTEAFGKFEKNVIVSKGKSSN